jgi:putative DNA primase/helicase
MVAWLVATLRPGSPFPILVLQGEQGSAKSTAGRMLRMLIDPAKPADRARPRDERDLAIAARNAWVLSYDNLSGIPDWLSDAFCRISTGSGFATRALHTDTEEAIFEACRPVMLNGIDELLTRPDLADRALRVTLPVIPEEHRLTSKEVREKFEAQHALFLGALCDAVCGALRELPAIEAQRIPLPRMADFVLLATAAESALGWARGTFLSAYKANRSDLFDQSLEADAVASAIHRFLTGRNGPSWTGTAGELLQGLDPAATLSAQRSWPNTPRGLADRIRRAAPLLRSAGIEVEGPIRQGHGRHRIYTLRYVEDTGRTGRTGRTSEEPSVSTPTTADDAGELPQVADGLGLIRADRGRCTAVSPPRFTSEADAADVADADLPCPSNRSPEPDGRQK